MEMKEQLEQLSARMDHLEHENARLDAVVQIQNIMSLYSYYHASNMHKACAELFARHTPGVAVDIPHIGVYDSGYEGIIRCYEIAHESLTPTEESKKGMMMLRPFTTPVIQVAADGKTAKGLWLSPGLTTGGNPQIGYQASWAWIKYGCDFVLEEDGWKIWHLRVYGIFMTPFEESWVTSSQKVIPPEELGKKKKMMAEREKNRPAGAAPDRTNDDYDWTYGTDKIYPTDMPVPPTPYDTWDDSMTFMYQG